MRIYEILRCIYVTCCDLRWYLGCMIVSYFAITRNDLDGKKIWWNASKQQIFKRRDSIVWVLITTIVWCIVKYKNNVIYIPFDFGRTWWRLFQKRVVRTKFDIYVVLYIHATASNVVEILSFNIVGLQYNDLCWCQVCK